MYFQATIGLAQTHANDLNALKVIYSSLGLICKVFFSLNYQDLPEFFEDSMETWMTNFHTLLASNVQGLDSHVGSLFIVLISLFFNLLIHF